ncbi:hypothetical protein FRC09_004962 [Ceratobasidium sp. 395]|nr:hypothetical protein FRC09_004962 [Ceratobasidium sp. 395]
MRHFRAAGAQTNPVGYKKAASSAEASSNHHPPLYFSLLAAPLTLAHSCLHIPCPPWSLPTDTTPSTDLHKSTRLLADTPPSYWDINLSTGSWSASPTLLGSTRWEHIPGRGSSRTQLVPSPDWIGMGPHTLGLSVDHLLRLTGLSMGYEECPGASRNYGLIPMLRLTREL